MLSTIGLLVILSAEPTACPFGGAVYEARADRAWRLEVSDGTGGAMIRVRSAVTGTEYAFEISEGEGYPTATLASASPGSDVAAIPIYALTEDMDWLGEFPGPDDPAPRYLAAPELGKTLWYRAEALGGPSLASGQRETLPRTFFVLKDCRQA